MTDAALPADRERTVFGRTVRLSVCEQVSDGLRSTLESGDRHRLRIAHDGGCVAVRMDGAATQLAMILRPGDARHLGRLLTEHAQWAEEEQRRAPPALPIVGGEGRAGVEVSSDRIVPRYEGAADP